MMSSVRLDPELEAQVRTVACRLGLSASEVHRRALRAFCDAAARRDGSRYEDVIGAVAGPADLSVRTGEAFAELLLRERACDAERAG